MNFIKSHGFEKIIDNACCDYLKNNFQTNNVDHKINNYQLSIDSHNNNFSIIIYDIRFQIMASAIFKLIENQEKTIWNIEHRITHPDLRRQGVMSSIVKIFQNNLEKNLQNYEIIIETGQLGTIQFFLKQKFKIVSEIENNDYFGVQEYSYIDEKDIKKITLGDDNNYYEVDDSYNRSQDSDKYIYRKKNDIQCRVLMKWKP